MDMTRKIKLAIVGAGLWGTSAHAPAIQAHPQAELTAVQARTRERAEKVAADFNVPHACTTMEEVLAIDGLDAVVISSTPNAHYAQAKAALERGLHVVIEKPMTITAAEAAELVALAEGRGLHFVISCPFHYSPLAVESRRLIASGALGQVKAATLLFTNNTAGLYRGLTLDKAFGIDAQQHPERLPYRMPGQTSYSDPAVAGGGQVYTQVSHAAAFLGFLMPSEPREVFARFDNADAQIDVYDSISVKLADGTLLSLVSHGQPMPRHSQFEVRVHGTRGALALELLRGEMTFVDAAGEMTRYPDAPRESIYPKHRPAQNLINAILGQEANGSPASLGLYAMKVIEASVLSAQTGQNILLAP